jgi:hypothetical protein
VREKFEQASIRPENRENHHKNNISPGRRFRQVGRGESVELGRGELLKLGQAKL